MEINLIIGKALSGTSAYNLLKSKNFKYIYFYDDKIANTKSIKEIKNINLKYIKNIIVSPGVNPFHPLIKYFISSGKKLINEIELASYFIEIENSIAITGTNGKSSVCKMINHILKKFGLSSDLVGNIGNPLSKLALSKTKIQNLIIELSSYQLKYSDKLKSNISIINNLAPDHIKWHGSLKEYYLSKLNLLNKTKKFAVIGEDVLNKIKKYSFNLPNIKIYILVYSNKNYLNTKNLNFVYLKNIKKYNKYFKFKHQILNSAMASILINKAFNINYEYIFNNFKDFKDLEHRFEIIYNDKFKIVNDSKSTNIHSTISAIKNINQNFILFLGGIAKDKDFTEIIKYKKNIKKIILFGESGGFIYKNLNNYFEIEVFENLKLALKNFQFKENVLFSPGCSSFDEFKNFEDRGDYFKKIVKSKLNI